MSSCWLLTNRKHQIRLCQHLVVQSQNCSSWAPTLTLLRGVMSKTKEFFTSYTVACYSLTVFTHLLHTHQPYRMASIEQHLLWSVMRWTHTTYLEWLCSNLNGVTWLSTTPHTLHCPLPPLPRNFPLAPAAPPQRPETGFLRPRFLPLLRSVGARLTSL